MGEARHTIGVRATRKTGQKESDNLEVASIPICQTLVFIVALEKMWSWREESNLQPAVYKTAALPLSYASFTPIVAY